MPTSAASPIASVNFQLDGGAVIRMVDDHVRNVLGYPPAELVGRTFFSLVHPDDLLKVIGYFSESASGKMPCSHGSARLRHRDGTSLAVNGIGTTAATVKGEFWLHLKIDVLGDEDATTRDPRLSQIARGIAHDLHNLLGSLNRQAMKTGDRAQLAAVCSALEAARGLAHSLDAAAEGAAAPSATDLNEAVRQLLPALHAMVAGTLQLTTDLHPLALPIPLAAADVYQILLNLLTNARQVTLTRGSAHIRTRVHEGRVCLEVENTGDLRGTLPVGPIVVRALPPAGTRGVGLITVANLVAGTGGTLQVQRSDDTTTAIVVTFGVRSA